MFGRKSAVMIEETNTSLWSRGVAEGSYDAYIEPNGQRPITSSFFVTEFGQRMDKARFTPEEKAASMWAFRQMKQDLSGFEAMHLHKIRGSGPFA